MQKGQLIEASGIIYIRFYRDGKRIAEKLCEIDDKNYSAKAKSVKLLRDKFMLTENSSKPSPTPARVVTVGEFWDSDFLPHVEGSLKPSSIHSYKTIWRQVLKDHLENKTFIDYEPADASDFLTTLAKRMGRRTLAHVRSLGSSIFAHAVAGRIIKTNPWREAKHRGKVRAPKAPIYYTDEQAKDFEEKLEKDPRSQAMFSLGWYEALRPGEIAALRWEDITSDSIHIKRSAWRGKVTDPKTEEAAASVPLISKCKTALEAWHKVSKEPTVGFLFQNRQGNPINMQNYSRRTMRPKLGPEWKGWYGARRGAATNLMNLTGLPQASAELLRHKNYQVTVQAYIQQDRSALNGAIAKLEKKIKKQ